MKNRQVNLACHVMHKQLPIYNCILFIWASSILTVILQAIGIIDEYL